MEVRGEGAFFCVRRSGDFPIKPPEVFPMSSARNLSPRRRCDLGQAKERLEATYSTADAMIHLGICKTKLHELLKLGKKFCGCHPLKGGLFPTYKVSHRNRRIPIGAIERHLAHMACLESDAMFAAQMGAAARQLGERRAA